MLSSCWCWYGENSISLSLGSISFQKFISAQLTSRQHLHAQESPYVLHWLLNASPTLDQQHKVFTAYLPSQTSNKILKGPARSAVGQYGVLVLLSLSHIYHSYLVGLSAETVPHSVTTYQIFCSPFNQPCIPHLSCWCLCWKWKWTTFLSYLSQLFVGQSATYIIFISWDPQLKQPYILSPSLKALCWTKESFCVPVLQPWV